MGCLDENTIVEFIQGTLSMKDARGVEEHVDACESCRQLMAEMARTSFAILSPEVASITGDPSMPTDPSASMEGLRVGQVVAGRYRVARFLGKGGMGRVYEVEDLQLQDRVALKLLRAEVADLPRLLQHLKHEVVLGRRISHPNVCRLHDIGSFAGHHFITMSLVHGENLTSILSREVPPPEWALNVLLQICDALEAAHEQGVVHRDLKSSNIMVDTKGKVTVMDFGLARDLWGEPSQSGMLVGSPAYWSPEQACGHRATERSDIYSFGVVACELFGARRPLMGEVDLSRVPVRFRPVIMRCLQSKCEERYGSAAELQAALRAAECGPPPSGGRWKVVAAVAVILVVAIGAGVMAYTGWPGAESDPDVAPLVATTHPPRGQGDQPLTPPIEGASKPSAPPAPPMVFGPDEVKKTKRTRPRVRRRGLRSSTPPPVASTSNQPDAGGSGPSPEAKAMRAAVGRQLGQLESRRTKTGFLLDDLPQYRRALGDARKALSAKDTVEAKLAVERMGAELDRSRVDKAFIARKLARVTKLKGQQKLDQTTGKKVHNIFSKVHGTYFAGDYKTANMHLNRLWRILHRGGR